MAFTGGAPWVPALGAAVVLVSSRLRWGASPPRVNIILCWAHRPDSAVPFVHSQGHALAGWAPAVGGIGGRPRLGHMGSLSAIPGRGKAR